MRAVKKSVKEHPSKMRHFLVLLCSNRRRELLDDKLKNYRQEKLKRKLPVDTQLLVDTQLFDCAKEELQIKKRCK